MRIINAGLLLLLTLFTVSACKTKKAEEGPLPIIGYPKEVDGEKIYPTIPDFAFMNQDSQLVTNETFEDKMYIVDFFFIHCPTICPKVKANGLRVYERFKDDDRVVILSHSIDTRNDTIPALKKYADKLGIETDRWHLVTGEKDDIYSIADDYFSVAVENPDAPGGFDHSGRLILVDRNRHVRSFCDGTDNESVDRFMEDVQRLIKEYDEADE